GAEPSDQVVVAGDHLQGGPRPMPFGLLINVASVGLPLDGLPLAAYTVLSVADGGWVVEQRRVPYDPAREAAAAASAGLPPWTPDSSRPSPGGPSSQRGALPGSRPPPELPGPV